MADVQILPMMEADYDAVRALWMTIRGFGIRALDDSREDVARFIRRNPTTSVVARADGRRVTLLRVPADAAGDARAAAVLARLRECNPDMETHPAARPPIFEAKEFDV